MTKPAMLDTNILSMFFKGQTEVVQHVHTYQTTYDKINFSLITYYEIISGLKHRDAHKQLDSFLQFAAANNIIALTLNSVSLSANIYADLRKQGNPIDDIDLLIAGTALAHNLVLVTHNRKHFERIESLQVEDWSKP